MKTSSVREESEKKNPYRAEKNPPTVDPGEVDPVTSETP